MRELFDGFYRGKKVLVTGHTGFKGAWLSAWLSELGAEATGYALDLPTIPNLFEVAGLSGKMTSIRGDVRDAAGLKTTFRECRPDIVIHMAAQSLVRRSYEEPLLTYETNVMGTINVFEICRCVPSVRALVNVTSDKCYENCGQVKNYKESDPIGGYDPYSSSKGCSELVTQAYLRSFFNPKNYRTHAVAAASARSGNVIGGGDWSEDRLIPDGIRAFTGKKSLLIRYPDAIRPWQHVLEPLYGYLLLAKCLYEKGPSFSGAWNFGPNENDARPVRWVAERMADMWGAGATWDIDDNEKLHEANYLKLDCSKARLKLGWRPQWDLETALDNTISWYKAYYDGKDMAALTVSEIKIYEESLYKRI